MEKQQAVNLSDECSNRSLGARLKKEKQMYRHARIAQMERGI